MKRTDGLRFAALLREYMAGKSTRQVAMASGLHYTTVAGYLAGTLPDTDRVSELVNRLADALGADADKFLAAVEEDRKWRAEHKIARALPSDVVSAVAFALRSADDIPAEGKRQIIEYVKQVRDRYAK